MRPPRPRRRRGRADREALDDCRRRRGRLPPRRRQLGRYEIEATPLGAPTVTLLEPPRGNLSGSLTLHYSLADRYGIAGAEAEFAKPAAGAAPPRSLVAPPKLTLRLPSTTNGTGEASTTGDLSEHPWAGAEVVLNLKATGVSGKVGAGAPTTFTLPQRAFHNPLARALVEQRRALVLDPDHEPPRVAKAIDALTIAPDLFQTPAGVYLGLRQARAQLADAHGDADLLAVADLLWAMALRLEDGDASQAQRDLRAAEQKLREALQRGASDEELRKLTQELRDAAERYMRDLAQQAPQQPNDADAQLPQQDLESMLDRMEDMARNGARQDAEAMLDEMQNMFENMRGAERRPGRPGEPRNAQADGRARQAAARPAGVARRHVPPGPARAARPRRARRPGRSGQSVARGAPARARRPPRRIAEAAEDRSA